MKVAIILGVLALTVAVSSGFHPKAECEDKAEFVIPNFKVCSVQSNAKWVYLT